MTLHGKYNTLVCLVMAGLIGACVKNRAPQEVAAPADPRPQANEAGTELVLMSSVVIGGYEINVFDKSGSEVESSWRHRVLASPDRVYWDHSGQGSPSLIFLKDSTGAGGSAAQKKTDKVVLTAHRDQKLGVYWALDGHRTKVAESPDLDTAAVRIDNDLEKQKVFLASHFGENLSVRYYSALTLGNRRIKVAMDMDNEACGIEHIWSKHVVGSTEGGSLFKAELFAGDKDKVKELADEVLEGFNAVYLQKDGKLLVIKEFKSALGSDDDRPAQNIALMLSPHRDGKRVFYSLTTMRPVVDSAPASSDFIRIDLAGSDQEQFFKDQFVASAIVSERDRSLLAGQSLSTYSSGMQATSDAAPKAVDPTDGHIFTDIIFGSYDDAVLGSEWMVVPQDNSAGGTGDTLTNEVVSNKSEGN